MDTADTADKFELSAGCERIILSLRLLGFLRLTITPTIQYHISIYLPCKQIHPACYRAFEIVQPVLIPDFVLYAHVLYLGMLKDTDFDLCRLPD